MERQPKPEPEPDPVSSQPSDPSLSKAPPLFYQAASKFCPHDLKADLPPPYPDGPGHRATASHAPQAAVYTSLTVPDYPQTPATASDAAYPPSWSSPA